MAAANSAAESTPMESGNSESCRWNHRECVLFLLANDLLATRKPQTGHHPCNGYIWLDALQRGS
jgi:hypothetical protein